MHISLQILFFEWFPCSQGAWPVRTEGFTLILKKHQLEGLQKMNFCLLMQFFPFEPHRLKWSTSENRHCQITNNMLLAVQRQAAVQPCQPSCLPRTWLRQLAQAQLSLNFLLCLCAGLRTALCFQALSFAAKIGLNGSMDCTLSASFNGNIEERAVPI